MLDTLKKIFGGGPSVDYKELLKAGAIIVDVRTPGEYSGGHIEGSMNVPLDQLKASLKRFPDKEAPIITCCASGMRSGTAKGLLQAEGYTQVFNGGGWRGLQGQLAE